MNKYVKMLIIIGLLLALFCPGCAGGRKAIVKNTFLLEAQRPDTLSSSVLNEVVLAVHPFSIAPAFKEKGLVYRIGDNQYESDFYNEYFISPASMVTEQTRNWLSESNPSIQVLSSVSSVRPMYVLEGHIKQIDADLRDKNNPQAVLEVSFFLLEQDKRFSKIRFHETYSADRPLESKTAPGCILALNQCLSEILEKLEKDLASNLAPKTE